MPSTVNREEIEEFHIIVQWIIDRRHTDLRALDHYKGAVNSLHKTRRNAEEPNTNATVVNRTALYDAKNAGRKDLAEKLLELGADETIDPTAVFMDMVLAYIFSTSNDLRHETEAKLVEFVNNNKEVVNINDTGTHVYAALHHAAYSGHEDLVKTLLRLGADVNASTSVTAGQRVSAITPLHCAIERLHPKIVDLLCDHGADLAIQTRLSESPSELAERALNRRNELSNRLGYKSNISHQKFDSVIKILEKYYSTVSSEEMFASYIAELEAPEVDITGDFTDEGL